MVYWPEIVVSPQMVEFFTMKPEQFGTVDVQKLNYVNHLVYRKMPGNHHK